nr:aldolase [Nitrososphaerota archaeon]
MRSAATMNTFLRNGKSMLLAYDQGFEHGPSLDFNDKNVDPSYVMDIAVKGGFNGIVFQKGIAEKYYDGKVPLIVKVNAKSALPKGEPNSKQNCTVKYAVTSLEAKAIGYTIYLGSQYEGDMFK